MIDLSCYSPRRKVSIWGVLFFSACFFSVLAGEAQPLQEPQLDAVYLLDVTSSMVGSDGFTIVCDKSKDILKQVLDFLLLEIERFPRGRLILITFAEGPYDLDPFSDSIQAIYRVDMSNEQEKLLLKQFIRPSEYGVFLPNWPGVYEEVYDRTCNKRKNIGNTAIYDSILVALKELEQLQTQFPDGPEDYATTHIQEIVVFTDGEDNASKNTFERVLDQLKERHFQMAERFRYKRYLFSDKPEDIQEAEGECAQIERQGAAAYAGNVVAPDISQLVTLDLDRRILGFSNLWAPSMPEDSRTVLLKNIQIYYDKAKAKLLEDGQLIIRPVKPEEFSLPGDIAVKVRTDPAELKFPIEQFDLFITLEPFSRLKAFMSREHKEGLKGLLRFEFVKGAAAAAGATAVGKACKIATGKESLIDFKQSSIPIDLPYVRPALQANWIVERGEAFALTLTPNDVFQSLSADEQQARVDYNEKHFALVDDQGRGHKSGEPVSLQGVKKLVLRVREELTPGSYKDSIKLTPGVGEVDVNGTSAFETSYEFWVIGFDRQKLVFPNLWARTGEISGDTRTVTSELQLVSVPHQVQISIKSVDFGLAQAGIGIDLAPKTVEPPFDRRTIQLTLMVKPYSLLSGKEDLQTQINQAQIDGYLLFEVAMPAGQLAKLQSTRLPVDLVYRNETPTYTVQLLPDQPQLLFPNIWTVGQVEGDARVVMVKGLRLNGAPDWGQLTLRTTGFNLPPGVTTELTPNRLNAPFEQFDLQISFRGALPSVNLPDQAQGTIEFDFSPQESDKGTVKLVKSSIAVVVDLRRPAVQVKVNGSPLATASLTLGELVKGDQALSLEMAANDVFMSLPEEQRRLTINDEKGYLVDESGTVIKNYSLSVSSSNKLNLVVSSGLASKADYMGRLTISSAVDVVKINESNQSLAIAYKFTYPPLDMSVVEQRKVPDNARVERGAVIATYEIKASSALLKDPRPVQVTYGNPFILIDDRGVKISSGGSIDPAKVKRLYLKIDPALNPPIVSHAIVSGLIFSAPDGIYVSGNQNAAYSYNLRLNGVLIKVFTGVGWAGLGLALLVFIFVVGKYAWDEGVELRVAVVEVMSKRGFVKTYAMPVILASLGVVLLLVRHAV